ncbi:MAG TPA: acyltransferase [Bacteroidia bacterium]|jgi:peptidoglycan/LPS O-acetylase OafA/YrhL|nr:acyltransferase [Bacteroidia bacterium]
MTDTQKKVHFPNLNGLRFFMALFIVLLHLEDIKYVSNRENIFGPYHIILAHTGALAVTAFFVMSGFLITYLLMKEKQNTGSIHVTEFYKRRILRIWPLYYFIIFLGFFVLPHMHITDLTDSIGSSLQKHFWLKLGFALIFLPPRLSGGRASLNQTLGQVWTIRVEEAFYLCWPLLLKRTNNYIKLFLWILAIFIGVHIGFDIIQFMMKSNIPQYWLKIVISLKKLLEAYRIDCMVIGGFGAYLIAFDKKKILSVIYRKDVQVLLYVITGLMLCFGIYPPVIAFEVYSVLFCLIMVNLGTNPNTIINLDYKWLDYLGKTAYGIYLYNSITRIFCIKFVEYIYNQPLSGWKMETTLYICSIGSTIIISILSYELLEKPFLKLKNRFAIVKNA